MDSTNPYPTTCPETAGKHEGACRIDWDGYAWICAESILRGARESTDA